VKPYRSVHDGHFKVPVSTQVVNDGRSVGILVASVSTPGTKALDDQRSFLRDLYLGVGISVVPLALFFLALGVCWLRPKLHRATASDCA